MSEEKPKRVIHLDSEKGNDLLGDGSAERPLKTVKGYHRLLQRLRITEPVQLRVNGSWSGEALNALFGQQKPNRAQKRAAEKMKRRSEK